MLKYKFAKISDIDDLIKLMDNTKYISYLYPEKSVDEIKKLIIKSMSYKKYILLFDSNKLIGYFIISPINNNLKDVPKKIKLNKNYAYHSGIGIHSNYRNKGLATKLTRYAFRKAKSLGYLGMYADVGSDNKSSINLQKKVGFEELVRYTSLSRKKGIKNIVFQIKF